jgi:hypothetical protein
MNHKDAPGANESEKMDFSRPDAIDAQKLNAILWQDANESKALPPALLRKPQGKGRTF